MEQAVCLFEDSCQTEFLWPNSTKWVFKSKFVLNGLSKIEMLRSLRYTSFCLMGNNNNSVLQQLSPVGVAVLSSAHVHFFICKIVRGRSVQSEFHPLVMSNCNLSDSPLS